MTQQSFTVEEVTTRAGFDALAASWEDLLHAQEEESPFLSHDWNRCCLDAAPERPIRTLAVRSGRTLVGIAPLWLGPLAVRGVTTRALTFITSSETAATDLVVHPDSREAVIGALLRHMLRSPAAGWDLVSLGQWPAESENQQVLLRLLSAARVRSYVRPSSVVPYVRVEGAWDSFWSSRTYLFRKSRRGILNRLARAGDLHVTCLGSDRAGEALEAYLGVAARGWKHGEGKSITSQPGTERFFRSLTEAAGQRGWLMVWVLYLQGTPVAAEYDLACGGRVHALRADFDQGHAAHSPGAALEYHILKYLFENGYAEYSTGPGRDTYKTRWTDSERANQAVTICRSTPRGTAAWLLEGCLAPTYHRGRALLARVRGRNP